MRGLEVNLIVPDLWQQEAVRALQAGQDVVVHAPTGAGKTYIFELLYPSLKGQAVFTVPTRALANDKLAEWRARGWDVGIATGDLALNLEAKVVVATLETQRSRFLRREGPRLLVVDEYQLIADPVRGVHYELSLALAPPGTQLLLLSGSVNNPQEVVEWLRRIGRDAVLVRHDQRPVPQHEVDLRNLPEVGFLQVREFWPRMIAKALHAGLAPVLVFAPRRNPTEEMAQAIASTVPVRDPLPLSSQQEVLAGKRLTKLLRSRVAYHHSGLSYAVRAGLIEPLAKAGQLNVVVATMGLAAGINFSMRSVLITDTRYLSGNFERQVEPDEMLQMFGRAGRRGLDDTGFVLFTPDQPRLSFARPRQLKRATQVDWPSLISVMANAADRAAPRFVAGDAVPGPPAPSSAIPAAEPVPAGDNVPGYRAAVEVSRSLFSAQRVPLGVEHSLSTGAKPCGLWVDAERARFVRRPIVEILNSREEWEPQGEKVQSSLGETLLRENERWISALRLPNTLDRFKLGNLWRLPEKKIYGRELPLATAVAEQPDLQLVKPLRKTLQLKSLPEAELRARVTELMPQWSGGGAASEFVRRGNLLTVRIDFSQVAIEAWRDSLGKFLVAPPERAALPLVCRGCSELEHDQTAEIVASPAYAWRRLGLVEPDGTPTRRGVVFGFFQGGEGLAIAAALEDETYPVDDLVFDLANIRAGPRFAGEDAPLSGRLGALCQRVYERADHPGYLEMGVPIHYGSGASEIIREVITNPTGRYKITSESLRHGDVERALMEWRSLIRHIASAPALEWDRWRALKAAAEELLGR
ncbi:MAG: DEAD/DEAH box helicase, partial [Verrucomicrobiota bacterium]|nr:DEAD/DEAH box helicase [Verrucomicrobiota bacterium]